MMVVVRVHQKCHPFTSYMYSEDVSMLGIWRKLFFIGQANCS